MINKILIAFIAVLSFSSSASENDLYDIYMDYRINYYKSQVDLILPIISNHNLSEKPVALNPISFDLEFPFISSITTSLIKEINHFEKIEGKTGCLVVNGFDSDFAPVSLTIKYIKEEEAWKFRKVIFEYLDELSELPSSVNCSSVL